MRFSHWIAGLSTSLLMATNSLSAASVPTVEQLQVPQCLASQLSFYPVLAENKEFKIIEVPVADITKIALLADKVHCGRFINVSHHLTTKTASSKVKTAQALLAKPEFKANIPEAMYEIKHPAEVNTALAAVDTQNIMSTLTHLTNYYNRSATTDRGKEVAQWLQQEFEAMAIANGREDTTTYFVETGWYKQPSLVTVIGKDLKEPGIVIGAHMDTLDGRMPGAGDDGSGSSSVMEIARVLLASKMEFKRPIYIIWYAAEERGLVGSSYVVEDFQEKGIPVKAAIQFDMTGFRNDPTDQTMWVFRDYTDKTLSNFMVDLIQTYVKVPVSYSKCGYGCSDHASWTKVGIPAAFPCETSFEDHNPYIHSKEDTMNRLYPEHMTNFAKLGIAFAIELASE
ncbi:aminopeptidase LapA [Legionella hackeliae]|uniref:Bacterial leucyl aminopeptidase n=1 Tax=Legionella hackeliae TaxID=449 RepID=A0A0A8UWW3_LEGHA|nr:M28 family peptidase [Legionella hackeliae]KTD12610.1 aminopeptidase [Legionella hackeliae]CEK12026.1 Bacterial leucyl aminopeptidase [Legionella hackeliae]STX48810.1 aminopeptidase [Legionella hackeliae]